MLFEGEFDNLDLDTFIDKLQEAADRAGVSFEEMHGESPEQVRESVTGLAKVGLDSNSLGVLDTGILMGVHGTLVALLDAAANLGVPLIPVETLESIAQSDNLGGIPDEIRETNFTIFEKLGVPWGVPDDELGGDNE